MTVARAALFVALLATSAAAQTTRDDASDIDAALRPSISAYRAGDLRTAETLLRALIPGNADAEAWLGALLLDRGDTRSGLKAIQQAADSGSPEGAHRLALVFAEGLGGTARNEKRAAELFEKAAAAGHTRAQLNLGILYFRGQGVVRDLVQARAWLEKAAANGDAQALYALGRAMDERFGPAPVDLTRAADLYRQAAEKGHPLAALRLGLALSEGAGIKRDIATAQTWLLRAYENGVPEAALALGDLTARAFSPRDKAANVPLIQSALGWYEAAANAGVASAQFKLANAHFSGTGVARDAEKALFWYGRAASQGLAEAQHAYAIMLIGGITGAVDAAEGYKWLLLAERGGHPDSRAVRLKADEQIPAKDRARAETLAKNFKIMDERPDSGATPRLAPPAKP